MMKSTLERARAYIASIPGAVSGNNGHAVTFHVACVLIIGFALSFGDALAVFQLWNATCQPPWTEAELRHKLADAQKAPSVKPRGYLLNQHCGSAPAAYAKMPCQPPSSALPNRGGFVAGTAEQLQQLARNRPYHREGLEWASERGVLVFGQWHGFDCYGVTDGTSAMDGPGRAVEGGEEPITGGINLDAAEPPRMRSTAGSE